MQFSGVGTAVMFAVAAILWFVYLVPTWVRRREYLATERNATRLQQTLRIMAETAETPAAVRVEATARSAAHQERLLRERERQRAARERAALAATRRAQEPAVAEAERRRTRRRRARLLATATFLAALATASVQTGMVLTGGAVTGSWIVLAAAGVGLVAALGTLRTLARRRIPAPVIAASVVVPTAATAPVVAAAPRREWTPVPVPRPRYLGTPAPQPIAPALDAERLLREASAEAQEALRVARGEAEVVEFPRAPAAASGTPTPAARPTPAAPSRWASMGVVGDLPATAPDLDEVLRRRRAAG
ncbi:MAG: hypothetical protein HY996_04285 [Micrococcales bacterium]|nr:hypothetical protein [Micrococcales bacterium]